MQVLRLYRPWYGVEYVVECGGLHDLGMLCFNEGQLYRNTYGGTSFTAD
jgi:hypothetical protein